VPHLVLGKTTAWSADKCARGPLTRPAAHDMVSHMKTTIDIADPILIEAKRVAVEDGTTLRELVERGLEAVLRGRRENRRRRLRDASFAGQGVQPGVSEGDWDEFRERLYEGRGA